MNSPEKAGLMIFIISCCMMLQMQLQDNPNANLAHIFILIGAALFMFGNEIEK